MLVSELIEKLKETDGDRLVVLSCDEEMNRVLPLVDTTSAGYVAKTETCCIESLTAELVAAGYGEEDLDKGHVSAFLLIPGEPNEKEE